MRIFIHALVVSLCSATLALAGCAASSDDDATDDSVQAEKATPKHPQLPAQERCDLPTYTPPCHTPSLANGPVTQAPTFPGAVYLPPVVKGPVYGKPAYQEPGAPIDIQAPVYPAPKFEAPIFKGPIYEAPKYEGPVYFAPKYEAPTYEPGAKMFHGWETPCGTGIVPLPTPVIELLPKLPGDSQH